MSLGLVLFLVVAAVVVEAAKATADIKNTKLVFVDHSRF